MIPAQFFVSAANKVIEYPTDPGQWNYADGKGK